MTKKIKDLTLEEYIEYCRSHFTCYTCPIYKKFELDYCTIYELYNDEEIRNYEVEIKDGKEKV